MTFQEPPENFKPRFEITGCLVECEGNILILKRLETKSHGGKWGMPAGKIDAGETPEQAIARELKEETGLATDSNSLILVKKLYMRIPEYDLVYYLYRLPLANKPVIEINPKEHQTFQWLTPQSLLKLDFMHDFDECLKVAYGITT